MERDRALKDSDPTVSAGVSKGWATSGEFEVELTREEQLEAAKKEEARMKAHFL